MKRRISSALAAAGMLLTSCGMQATEEEHSLIDEIAIEDSASETTVTETETTELPETTVTTATSASQKSGTITTGTTGATTGSETSRTRTDAGSGGEHTVLIIQNHNGDAPETKTTRRSESGITTTGTAQTTSAKSNTSKTTTGKTTTSRTTTKTTPKTTATTRITTTEPPQPRDIYGRLRAMSLQEKAEQMMMSSASDEAAALAAIRRGAGAMCLFAGAFSGKSAAAVQQMTANMQAAAKTPVLIAVDEEGGPVNRVSLNPQLRSEPFRNSRVIFDEGGWDALRGDTAEKADLLLSLGVNVNLGPVCDVPLDPGNYIYARTFGLDPHETAGYADTVVSEMRARGLGSVLKHFPGYGGSIDTHQFMAYDSRDFGAFTGGDFLPFIAGINAGADAVMVSHNIVTCMDAEHPASLSPEVHRILREELGFGGVIMTDDLGMNAINLYTGGQNAAVAAVLAGNDIVTFADDAASADAIVSAVRSGLIAEEQIDESVLRILRWKQSLGLIE